MLLKTHGIQIDDLNLIPNQLTIKNFKINVEKILIIRKCK
jgi:hypothetical protein